MDGHYLYRCKWIAVCSTRLERTQWAIIWYRSGLWRFYKADKQCQWQGVGLVLRYLLDCF